jgi:prolyl 4-hydroxylase
MSNFILIKDDLLNKEEMNNLINFYNDNLKYVIKFRDTFPLVINNNFLNLQNKINDFLKIYLIDWWQIVHWPLGSYQNLHFDKTINSTPLTSISYLNNDFTGGETFFEDQTIIHPKLGRTLLFNGQEYKHGVKQVLTGNRYTLAIWYKNG